VAATAPGRDPGPDICPQDINPREIAIADVCLSPGYCLGLQSELLGDGYNVPVFISS